MKARFRFCLLLSAAALAAVTRDEVCAAARQVHPLCVYLLQSEKGGED